MMSDVRFVIKNMGSDEQVELTLEQTLDMVREMDASIERGTAPKTTFVFNSNTMEAKDE